MKKVTNTVKSALNLPAITLEGALFLPDQLEKAALGQSVHQKEADYQVPAGLKIKDEYSRAFQIASAQWREFSQLFERQDINTHDVTQAFVENLLKHALGYHTISATAPLVVNDYSYRINYIAGRVPVVVAPFDMGLDESSELFAVEGSGYRRRTAFQLAQGFLNADETYLWAIVTNGRQLRLLRDADTLTRPSFLEIDLEDVLQGQRFSEFAMVWRLLHASRAPQANQTNNQCVWEQWREHGVEEGTRVREGLRLGVEQALITLGTAFLQHPDNQALRAALHEGALSKEAYLQQLLRLVYRLIFLFTLEERGLLHPQSSTEAARHAYAHGYALARFRDMCLKRRQHNHFSDHWQATRIVFKGLQQGEPRLALPALGGLFAAEQTPHLDAAQLTNKDFLLAIKHLRWAEIIQGKVKNTIPVDYRNMGPEELGSVYESLLELVPEINLTEHQFSFVGFGAAWQDNTTGTAGNTRKLTGSYYTPDSLVQELIKSALEPVIARRLADNPENPTEALLNIKVVDPACGSGHFLLAAARRLAEELAQLRNQQQQQEGAIRPQDYRHALREVISRCIYGVDRNPMAIELARMALWLEGFEEGRPLNFLDHHLQVGDALLGMMDLNLLEHGISNDAFKALSGDCKDAAAALREENRNALKQLAEERKSPQFRLPLEQANQLKQLAAIEAMPQNTVADIAEQEAAYQRFLANSTSSPLRHAADMLVGAFLLPKTQATQTQVPTTANLIFELFTDEAQHSPQHKQRRHAATQACAAASVFHWPLAFPQVFAAGGFDCVLGNPPWELVQSRDALLDELLLQRQKLWFQKGEYEVLSGRRDLYKLFLVLMRKILIFDGVSGFVVPVGFMLEEQSTKLRQLLFNDGSVLSILHLQNVNKKFFPDVHASYRFISLTYSNKKEEPHKFSIVVKSPNELTAGVRWNDVGRDAFDMMLGFDRTTMLFQSQEVAKTHKVIMSKMIELQQLFYDVMAEFHASNDKKLLNELPEESSWGLLKNSNIHYFSPYFSPVDKFVDVDNLKIRMERKGLDSNVWIDMPRVIFRDIARNDDTRTLISTLTPPGFVSTYDTPMLVPKNSDSHNELELAFYASFIGSFLADFIIRPYVDKHIKGYVLAHVPIPVFDINNKYMFDFAKESLSLYKKSWASTDSEKSYAGNNFDSHRILLDALCFKFSKISEDEIYKVFDSFSSIKNNELRQYGEYRTQRLVLEAWDKLESGEL